MGSRGIGRHAVMWRARTRTSFIFPSHHSLSGFPFFFCSLCRVSMFFFQRNTATTKTNPRDYCFCLIDAGIMCFCVVSTAVYLICDKRTAGRTSLLNTCLWNMWGHANAAAQGRVGERGRVAAGAAAALP